MEQTRPKCNKLERLPQGHQRPRALTGSSGTGPGHLGGARLRGFGRFWIAIGEPPSSTYGMASYRLLSGVLLFCATLAHAQMVTPKVMAFHNDWATHWANELEFGAER